MFDNRRKVQSPVEFLSKDEQYQVSPISKIENDINGITRFAILKTTDNGKWMRGGMLFYEMNGVSIYTEDSNIIFVNLDTKTMFVRDNNRVEAEINPVNPEEKEYIILYADLGFEDADEGFPLRWEACTGRTMTYENIKANIEVIDPDKSIVLAETVTLKDALTVREFMNYLKNSSLIVDDSFDINDYSGDEYF